MTQIGKKLNAAVWAMACFAVFTWSGLGWKEFSAALAASALLITAANLVLYRNSFRKGAEITILLLPVFWLGAGGFLASLINTSGLLTLTAVVWAAVLFLIELRLDQMSVQLFEGIFFISSAGVFLGIWAADFYFSPGWWMIMVLIFISCFLLFGLGFRALPVSQTEKYFYALILSFAMTEVAWTMLFWPLHYFLMAVAFAGIFYAAWMITRLSLSRVLTLKKVLFHLLLAGAMELLALSSAVWLPVA